MRSLSSKGQYILENVCGSGCPCRQQDHFTHLNAVKNHTSEEENTEERATKWVNIRGREEHETLINDASWCKELGLDQEYEIKVYLRRWGGWLEGS